MRRLQSDAEYRRKLAWSAREGFVNHWSESAVIPRYLDLVRRVAEKKEKREVSTALTAESVA